MPFAASFCLLLLLLFSIAEPAYGQDRRREELAISDSLWGVITAAAGHQKMFGFSEDEMRGYGPDEFVLRSVWSLFRNGRSVPRFSGTLSKNMIDNHKDAASLLRTGYGVTDISAARMLPMAPAESWGVAQFPDSLSAVAVWEQLLEQDGVARPTPTFLHYPPHLQKLIVRLLLGIRESQPWINAAFNRQQFFHYSGLDTNAPLDEWYAFAAAPWNEDRLGQSATLRDGTFQALRATDRRYLAFGSALLATHVGNAIAEFRSSDSAQPMPAVQGMEITTTLGTIRILGSNSDTVSTPSVLTIDCGGNDLYLGRQAVNTPFRETASVLIDLAGNDVYDSDTTLSLACGVFGVAMLVDMAGNDNYRVRESGIACAWYGSGLLMDMAGNDHYVTDRAWGEAAAHVGVAVLSDWEGDDEYICAQQSQGMGSTLGAGLLVDAAGNDRYIARDDGNPTPIYLNQSVAMSQGCGYGRRADLGDGHSLAGGVGALADADGDDYYSAPVWAQGCGYWWGVGICEDRRGNDTWRSGKYSIGAAAHFAIGCKVDAEGNDTYAVGYTEAVNQYLGHARDGSIGIAIDGNGNDQYHLKTHCGGTADLGSLALLWDAAGNDLYTMDTLKVATDDGWSDTPPLGGASGYPPFYNFRDDIQSYGVFLDTGGKDSYQLNEANQKNIPWKTKPTDNSRWLFTRSPRERGIGIDMELRKTSAGK
ncbi:MAG: hypothetical protein IT211_11600 [Armatimonadetes bacterium]|nr:hypothetical protein [Armatimonadota bacterium]